MTEPRPTASTINDEQLDQLYAERARAEATLTRIRALRDDLRATTGARYIADALDTILGPAAPAPTATNPQCGSACSEGHTYGFRCEQQHAPISTEEQPAPAATEPHTGLVVQPYRNDQGRPAWVFRCWGTDTCDGWLSLDHSSQQSAERARDRHVAEQHDDCAKEQH